MKVDHLPLLKDILNITWIGSDVQIMLVGKDKMSSEIFIGSCEECIDWCSDGDGYTEDYTRHVVYMNTNDRGRIIMYIY